LDNATAQVESARDELESREAQLVEASAALSEATATIARLRHELHASDERRAAAEDVAARHAGADVAHDAELHAARIAALRAEHAAEMEAHAAGVGAELERRVADFRARAAKQQRLGAARLHDKLFALKQAKGANRELRAELKTAFEQIGKLEELGRRREHAQHLADARAKKRKKKKRRVGSGSGSRAKQRASAAASASPRSPARPMGASALAAHLVAEVEARGRSLGAIFDVFDTNDDSLLSKDELLSGMASIGIDVSAEQVALLFTLLDRNGTRRSRLVRSFLCLSVCLGSLPI
jgi:hypothetical protein